MASRLNSRSSPGTFRSRRPQHHHGRPRRRQGYPHTRRPGDPEYTASLFSHAAISAAMLGVPLVRDGEAIGVFTLTRSQPRPFTDHQVELTTAFADQAVIAIENVRLFNETQQSLARQARADGRFWRWSHESRRQAICHAGCSDRYARERHPARANCGLRATLAIHCSTTAPPTSHRGHQPVGVVRLRPDGSVRAAVPRLALRPVAVVRRRAVSFTSSTQPRTMKPYPVSRMTSPCDARLAAHRRVGARDLAEVSRSQKGRRSGLLAVPLMREV